MKNEKYIKKALKALKATRTDELKQCGGRTAAPIKNAEVIL